MPQLTTPKELFVHELQDMYYAEQTLTKVLPKLASESTDRELSKAFTHHLAETKEQIVGFERDHGAPQQGHHHHVRGIGTDADHHHHHGHAHDHHHYGDGHHHHHHGGDDHDH